MGADSYRCRKGVRFGFSERCILNVDRLTEEVKWGHTGSAYGLRMPSSQDFFSVKDTDLAKNRGSCNCRRGVFGCAAKFDLGSWRGTIGRPVQPGRNLATAGFIGSILRDLSQQRVGGE